MRTRTATTTELLLRPDDRRPLSPVESADTTTCQYSVGHPDCRWTNGALPRRPPPASPATTTDESSNTTSYTLDRLRQSAHGDRRPGQHDHYTRNDNSQVTEMVQPAVVNGTSTAAPTTIRLRYRRQSAHGAIARRIDPDLDLHELLRPTAATFDEVTEYTDGLGNETVYSLQHEHRRSALVEQDANGTTRRQTRARTPPPAATRSRATSIRAARAAPHAARGAGSERDQSGRRRNRLSVMTRPAARQPPIRGRPWP